MLLTCPQEITAIFLKKPLLEHSSVFFKPLSYFQLSHFLPDSLILIFRGYFSSARVGGGGAGHDISTNFFPSLAKNKVAPMEFINYDIEFHQMQTVTFIVY